MIKEFTPLASHPLQAGTTYARPTQPMAERVKLSSAATDVMTDLNRVALVSVRSKTPIDKANAKMIQYGVRLLIVLDDNENLVGLITAADILGEKPVNFMQHMGCSHNEVMVRDIMSTHREVETLNIDEVRNAKVGDIVATLKKAQKQHALVAQTAENGNQRICGLFSLTQIARQLGIEQRNHDLTEIFGTIDAMK